MEMNALHSKIGYDLDENKRNRKQCEKKTSHSECIYLYREIKLGLSMMTSINIY